MSTLSTLRRKGSYVGDVAANESRKLSKAILAGFVAGTLSSSISANPHYTSLIAITLIGYVIVIAFSTSAEILYQWNREKDARADSEQEHESEEGEDDASATPGTWTIQIAS